MTSVARRSIFVAAAVLGCGGCAPGGAAPRSRHTLDTFAEQAIREWRTPGFAIAVVRGDSVVLLRGFGRRRSDDSAAVDPDTRFAIASTGKAITAVSVARLVDAGRLHWDDPAVRYLPELRLYDEARTRAITIRDLLTHRSGLPRGDSLWYDTGASRMEVLRRVRFLKPEAPLRARFGYQSIMYLAAGEFVSRVTSEPWDAFVAREVLVPLGMTATTTDLTSLSGERNVASPHRLVGDSARPISYHDVENMAPAGGYYSTARDMARWLAFHLGDGSVGGRRLLSAATLREMHTPQTPLDAAAAEHYMLNPTSARRAYALGGFVEDYRGRTLLEHTGTIDGMSAHVALLPAARVGVAVLSNMQYSRLPAHAVRYVLDRLLEQGRID